MGLREKVTITLVIIALTQIACRHCMPRTPRKASLKRYLNDLKPVKNNPVSTPYSPSKVNKPPKQTFGKTAQNGRISQKSLPTKSLYDTYNFPENEYPLDNAPRDAFRIGMNFNENNHVHTLQKARNLQSSAINDLKKEMKMKRKLLSNKQVNNENIPLKTDISSIKIASNPDSVRLLDPETFPEVQYPLNTMDTWGQNYWNYLPFTQEKQLNRLEQQASNPKVREGINQPFTRLTKANASKFLQSYDKLKEEHRRTSTENSKRSNVGQKGLNFTKTATCERVSDDFITAGLLSNTFGNPLNTKTLDSSSRHMVKSAENTCPLIENPNHPMPLPYKVIEKSIENVCPAIDLKNNTQELEDVEGSVIAKTLQLIEEILLNDDTSSKEPPKTKNKEKENNTNTTETDCTGGSANKDLHINPIDNAETSTAPIEELSQEISDDAHSNNLPDNLPSLPEETIPETTTIVAGPPNVRMPLPFTEPITYGALTSASSPDLTNTTTLSNVNSVRGYTSIIIIPMNNDAVGKSHMFDTTSDKPIIVYLPSTQSSNIPLQTPPLNHFASSSLGNPVPNNQLYNDLFNMAPVQNNNPSSTALVSELNSISDSGSSLPIHEKLPTNSKYYNNENSPSSMREKPVSDILIHTSLIDDAPFVAPSCDEKLSQQPVQTNHFVVNPDTLPQTPDFEYPIFDFAESDIMSTSHGPYNNVLNNELPIIITCENESDQQITKTPAKDLFIATQNITTGHLHKTTSKDSVSGDSLSGSPNGVLTVALNKVFSSETPTDSREILKNLSDSLPNLPESTDKSISPSLIFEQNSESLQPIDEMLPTSFIETATVELSLPTEASLAPILLSLNLPEIMDTEVPPTIVSDITSDSALQPIDNTAVPSPISNSTPMTTDLTVTTELYKIRQILERMLYSEAPTVNQPPSMDTTLSPISEADSLPLLKEQSLSPIPIPTDSQPLPLDNVLSPIQTPTDSQPPPFDKVLSPIQTPTDIQPPPLDKVLSPISDTDSLPLLENQSLLPTQTPTDSVPLLAEDKTLLLLPVTDNPIDSLQLQDHETIQKTPIHKSSDDTLPSPMDKSYLSNSVLETIESPRQPLDKTVPPIPLFKTTIDNKPYVIDDLVTPPYEHVTSLTRDITNNGLLHQMDDLPLKMDFEFPHIYQANNEDLPLSVDDFPIKVNQKNLEGPLSMVDSQPMPLDKVLSPIQTPTDSQPPPFDKVLPPIQTPTDIQPPPLDKVLSPISNTDSMPLLENQSLLPTQTPTDSVPILAGDKTLLLLPVTDSPIDSLQLQDHETIQKTPIHNGSDDTLPSPMDKSYLSNSVLETIESPPQPLDTTVPPIPLFKTTIDNKPYVIDDLVTPPYEHVTSRTRDITNNGLLHQMDDLPLKLDFEFPHIYQANNEDLALSVDDFPIKVNQKNLEGPLSMVELPMDVIGIPDLLFKTPLSDLLKPTEVLTLPVEEVLGIASPGFPLDCDTSLMSDSMDNEYQDFPASKDPSDGLPMDEFKSENHEIISNSQFHEISSEIQPQKYDLPLSAYKLIPDVSLSEAHYNEPFVIDDSSSPVTDKISEIPNSTADTKDHPLGDNRLLSLEDDASSDTFATDIPIAVLPSLNETIQSTYLDRPSDEVLSDLDRDDLPLPDDKTLLLPYKTPTNLLVFNKTLSSSKLPITKALLENVLSDITKGVLSSQVAKALPVTSPSDKTFYYVDEKSSLSETKEIPLLPVENSFTNAEDNLIDNLSQITKDTPPTDLPFEVPLPIDKMYNDKPEISTDNAVGKDENASRTSDHFSDDQPKDKISSLADILSGISRNEKSSSSKLPITKALLENVLSEINSKDFSIPLSKPVSATSSSVLDKTHYYLDSPLSDFTDDSPSLPEDKILFNTSLIDNNLPFSGQPEDTLSLEDKTLSEIQSIDIPTEVSSPKDKIVSNADLPSTVTEIDPFPKDTPRESQLSSYKNKTPSSSKLPIAKALLENVLSDINTKSFSLPVASRSQLDKTLYFLEPPRPATTEESSVSDVPTEHDHYSEINEDVSPLSADKVIPDNPIMDIPIDELISGKMYENNSDDLTEEVKDSKLFSEELTDDFLLEMEKPLSLDDMPDDLSVPPTKQLFSSRLPITKALLEKVLSDITDGAIAAEGLLNHPNL